MEKNIRNKESKTNTLLKISICFVLLFAVFLALQNNVVLATNEGNVANEKQYVYLSDIKYKTATVGSGSLYLDKNINNGLITVSIDGKDKVFLKGIFAHAGSTVVYDISQYNYDYFTAYIGVDIANRSKKEGDGVKFKIYTSQDGENWTEKLNDNDSYHATKNSKFVQIDIKNAKYLKLVAEAGKNNWSDHSVYANAKLIKEGYEEQNLGPVDFIKTVEEYDTILKNYNGQEITGDYELKLLQRELVKNVGYDMLQLYASDNEENRQTLSWLFNNVDILRLYILGGKPAGTYMSSLKILNDLYQEYSDDFTNTELLNNKWKPNLTYGDLYKKMAISLSLTHSQTVGLWMQSGRVENQSDALRRYAIYKYMHKNELLKASASIDLTPLFESLEVEEMRFIMNNAIDDEEILWLNNYVKTKIIDVPAKAWLTPHPHIAYVWPNYSNAVYYDENNKDYFNELFAIYKTDDNAGEELVNENGESTGKVGLFDTEFNIPGGKNVQTYKISVTRGTANNKVYKVWMNFRNKFGTGAVCGGISKSGSNIRATHGIPATVIGQPGHAALLFYSKNAEGKGYWGIDNDVSGWTRSEKGERMLLGWGNASYSRGYSVVYMVLAQEALNDYANLVKCEELVMLADVYNDDLSKKEEIYTKALEVQNINIDAWYGLITTFNANENKTEDDYYALAERLAEKLKCFPLPMYHLTNLIKPKLTSPENIFKFTLLQTRILKEASLLPNTATDQVLQPGVTRVEANYLLGIMDSNVAIFSFDGVDAGKIVLASKFDQNGVRWDYSLDGKQNWNEVSFTAEEEHKWQLTPEEINTITATNDIYIHIVGVNYDENNLYKIDITEQAQLTNIYANDWENRVVGVNLLTEWRYKETDEWTSYAVASPDLTGDKTVQIRQAATGTKLASETSPIYTFTEDNQPDNQKYIMVSHLAIEAYSSQSVDTKRPFYAPNAIDANLTTLWHTDFRYDVTKPDVPDPFITIKLDEARYLSKVQFIQTKYKASDIDNIKNVRAYVSMDGENWTEAGRIENCSAVNEFQEIVFEESVQGQYIKLEMDPQNNHIFVSLAMVNLFEDITKLDKIMPTAGIAYSTTEPTNGTVVARLVNPSKPITITKPEDGSDTHMFTENGKFTFEFVDEEGNKGTAVATVTWIDKDLPTADVEYKLDPDKKLLVLIDNIDEDVYLLDENNNKINYIEVNDQKKITKISYLDSNGNVYKILEIDENGSIKKVRYQNTTNEVERVEEYVTTLEQGKVADEEYYDENGNSIQDLTDAEKEALRQLQQITANPLEYIFEDSGKYEFKIMDKANNITYKSIKVDYINNDTKILASDITYNITKATNKNVVATIKPYIIDIDGKNANVEIVNNNKNNQYTFTENGNFTFEYKDSSDTDNREVKQHTAKVSWIDKVAPTATVTYSTMNKTDEPVIATLSDESEEIIITNNHGNREHTFTENGTFTFEFEDIAGNKGTVTAKVDWIVSPEYIFRSNKYNIEEEYVSRIAPGTTIAKFKENVETNQELVFTDKDGNILAEDATVTTGTKLKVGDNLNFTLIVTGDITGSGEVGITDLAKLKLHYVELEPLTGIQLKAADVNGDGEIGTTDIAQIKLIIVGLKTIE